MHRSRKLCRYFLLFVLVMRLLTACAPKIQLTVVSHEVITKTDSVTVNVTVRNDGDTIGDVGCEGSEFGIAKLIAADDTEYLWKPSNVITGAGYAMDPGNALNGSFTFHSIAESGVYTLEFFLAGQLLTVENISVVLPE